MILQGPSRLPRNTHLLFRLACQELSGKSVKLAALKAQSPAHDTIDCELTGGVYEPKHFATATAETGHLDTGALGRAPP